MLSKRQATMQLRITTHRWEPCHCQRSTSKRLICARTIRNWIAVEKEDHQRAIHDTPFVARAAVARRVLMTLSFDSRKATDHPEGETEQEESNDHANQ